MKTFLILTFIYFPLILFSQSFVSEKTTNNYPNFIENRNQKNSVFYNNSPEWVQTNGPEGGNIRDLVIDPNNPSILYGCSNFHGIYKTTNSGESWEYIENDDHIIWDLEISASNSTLFFSDLDKLFRSNDGGYTWQKISNTFENVISIKVFKVDPVNQKILYVGGRRYDGQGIEIYKTMDLGDSWTNISGNLISPEGSDVFTISSRGNGQIFIGINDEQLKTWHKGKVFYTADDGMNWNEVDFGQTEDRFVWSVFVNPNKLDEVWISEGPLYNSDIDNPYVYLSKNGGLDWAPVFPDFMFTSQVRVLGASANGEIVYISGGGGLCYMSNNGETSQRIDVSPEIRTSDLHNIAPHPNNPSEVFLPTGSGGIVYSNNYGHIWDVRNSGIASTNINLLTIHPTNPGGVFCASLEGEGVFRTEDFGLSWKAVHSSIMHEWPDELLVDPVEPENVWYVADIGQISKSNDYGNNWSLLNVEHIGGAGKIMNFNSIYTIGQAYDNTTYALNNGFGIFKTKRTSEERVIWKFLNLSDIDYSYSLAVDPFDSDVLFSGYNKKPFETGAKIRGSYDGGENWFTSLEIEGIDAVTSVVIDKNNTNNLYSAAVGDGGGILWESQNRGQSWNKVNDYFNFTTIHSFASTGSSAAYAGIWGGGTYKSNNKGATWEKLENEESFSAASLATDPSDNNVIYVADRTKAILYKSEDGGNSFSEFFNAGPEYRRLMHVLVDPNSSETIYVSAMKMGGPGKLGGLFKIMDGQVYDINGEIPRLPLNVTIDPQNSQIIYAVLHETGVYKSVNGGENWFDISGAESDLPNSGFNNLFIDPNNSEILYLLGGCDVKFETFASSGLDPNIVNGVYKSVDGGQKWININHGFLGENSGGIKNMIFYNQNSNHIYLGAENGVYYSTDGGENWFKSAGLPYTTLGGIDILGDEIIAYTNGAGIFKGKIQTDNSIIWETSSRLNVPVYFAQVHKDYSDEATIYASGYPGGIFKSADGGVTWHEKNFGMVSFNVDDPLRQGYYAFAQSQSNPDVLYLGLYKKGVYRSFNGGDTWYPVNGQQWEMFGKKITSLAIDNTNENIVYVASENGVYYTETGGQNWFEINQGLTSLDVKVLSMSPNNNLIAGTRGYGAFEWKNNRWQTLYDLGNWGVGWAVWDNRPMYQYTSLLIHPKDNSKMIMGTFPQGIYKSNDFGQSWKESNVGWTNDGVFSLICHPEHPDTVYAGTYNGINRSTDFGEHWEMWDNGMPQEQWVFTIDFDPNNPDIMYACSKNGENMGRGSEEFHGTVMKSVDGGKNWFEIVGGLIEKGGRNQEFYEIIVDHYDSNIIYLSASNAMFRSTDGGETWNYFEEGLKNTVPGSVNNVTNALVMSSDHSMLYFGTRGSGVWRRMVAPILPVNRLSAESVDQGIKLNWNFEDLAENFDHYNVYRSNNYIQTIEGLNPIGTIKNVEDTLFKDSGIIQGESYYYAVTTNTKDGYENNHFYVLGPVVESVTNVSDNKISNLFCTIIPNPNDGRFTLKLENARQGNYQVQIINELGQLKLEKESYSVGGIYYEEFEVSHLPKGNYFIKVSDGETVSTQKIILQ